MSTRLSYRILGALLGLGLLAAGPVRALDEGIDYQTLAVPQATETGAKVEVLELFWYGCPHCFQLEEPLAKWVAKRPAGVEFRRLPATLGPSWEPGSRTFFAMEQMGLLERLHLPLLRAIHGEHKRLGDAKAFADWMASQGVDRGEFVKAYNSFAVDMQVRKNQQIGTKYGLEGVPTVVINGKYRTSPTLTGGIDNMFKVLDGLVAKELGAAANK